MKEKNVILAAVILLQAAKTNLLAQRIIFSIIEQFYGEVGVSELAKMRNLENLQVMQVQEESIEEIFGF